MSNFRTTHTYNGTPVQMWHSRTIHPDGRPSVVVLTCYDAGGNKIEAPAASFAEAL